MSELESLILSFNKIYQKSPIIFDKFINSQKDDFIKKLAVSSVFANEIACPIYEIINEQINIFQEIKKIQYFPKEGYDISELFYELKNLNDEHLSELIYNVSKEETLYFLLLDVLKHGDINKFREFINSKEYNIGLLSRILYLYNIYQNLKNDNDDKWIEYVHDENMALKLVEIIDTNLAEKIWIEKNVGSDNEDYEKTAQNFALNLLATSNAIAYDIITSTKEEIKEMFKFPFYLKIYQLQKHPINKYLHIIQYLENFDLSKISDLTEYLLKLYDKKEIIKPIAKSSNIDGKVLSIGKSPWIYDKCGQSEEIYKAILKNVFLYLTGNIVPPFTTSIKFLDLKSNQSEFLQIFGVEIDNLNNQKNNPQIIWSKDKYKYQFIAFMDAFYSSSDIKWDKENTINYGANMEYRKMLYLDGKEIIPSAIRRNDRYKDDFKKWRKNLNKIVEVVIKENEK